MQGGNLESWGGSHIIGVPSLHRQLLGSSSEQIRDRRHAPAKYCYPAETLISDMMEDPVPSVIRYYALVFRVISTEHFTVRHVYQSLDTLLSTENKNHLRTSVINRMNV